MCPVAGGCFRGLASDVIAHSAIVGELLLRGVLFWRRGLKLGSDVIADSSRVGELLLRGVMFWLEGLFWVSEV